MGDVARQAGIATGTLYNYFDSKEQVLESLLAMLGDRFVDTLSVELDTVADPADGLARLVRASLAYIDDHRAVFGGQHPGDQGAGGTAPVHVRASAGGVRPTSAAGDRAQPAARGCPWT